MRTRLGSIAIALAIGAGVAVALWLGDAVPDPIGPGRRAPSFELPRLGGAEERLALHDLRGRVVLLNFWATWCKPCEDEMPAMERLYRRLHDSGFSLVAVSVDEDRGEVERFRERLDLTFPILHDPDQEVAGAFQTYRFPESYLIDREGTILARYIGPRDWDAPAYVDRIARLLGRGS